MDTNDRSQESIETGEETPDYGERPESPEQGHPAEETSPPGGPDPGSHEHPDDVQQPAGEEGDQTSTESPASPPEQANG